MKIVESILDNTMKMVLKYGIKSVTMDDISRKLGISKKTLYQYFANKKGLIKRLIECHIEEDESTIISITNASDNAIDEIVKIALHVLSFLRSMSPTMIYDLQKYYPDLWKTIEEKHYKFIREVIQKNISRGIKEGLYDERINDEIIAKLYIAKSIALVDEEFFPLKDYDKGELFKQMVTYHIRGIVSDKGRTLISKIDID